ncbi:DNA repair exonuclease [Paenibacillus sp. SC116]|uniref:metallophosphoesterase family protein n=1 Tax=Paenibacillus sp. SC116 TaxID=2968986 RepID=UPI00215B2479|nr:DNA repair exonuclease [Paenibacillus sp. SC116]MCR8843361.1 DNA repair exonuclease [Paenibacillus sp. SC116]
MSRMLRFIHAADLHLDSPLRGLQTLPDVLQERLEQGVFRAWDRLVDLAIQVEADAVLLSGDLHDSTHRSLRAVWRLERGMKRLSDKGIAVFIIHGNHDPLTEEDTWSWPSGVTVFGTDKPSCHLIYNRSGKPVAVVTGMSYGQKAVYDNIVMHYPEQPEHHAKEHQLQVVGSMDDGNVMPSSERLYRIGMLHGTVDGRAEHDPYAPCSRGDLIRKGYDYWALGHIHKREVIQEQPYIVYAGNIQGRHIKEKGAKGVYVVDVLEDGATELVFHPLDDVRWFDESLSLQMIETKQDLLEAMFALVEEVRGTDRLSCVRLTLTGSSELHTELKRGRLAIELEEAWREAERLRLEEGLDAVWPIQLRVHSQAVVDMAAWRESESFAGELIRMTDIVCESDDAVEELIQEALLTLGGNLKLQQWLGSQPVEVRRKWLEEALIVAVDMLQGEEQLT